MDDGIVPKTYGQKKNYVAAKETREKRKEHLKKASKQQRADKSVEIDSDPEYEIGRSEDEINTSTTSTANKRQKGGNFSEESRK